MAKDCSELASKFLRINVEEWESDADGYAFTDYLKSLYPSDIEKIKDLKDRKKVEKCKAIYDKYLQNDKGENSGQKDDEKVSAEQIAEHRDWLTSYSGIAYVQNMGLLPEGDDFLSCPKRFKMLDNFIKTEVSNGKTLKNIVEESIEIVEKQKGIKIQQKNDENQKLKDSINSVLGRKPKEEQPEEESETAKKGNSKQEHTRSDKKLQGEVVAVVADDKETTVISEVEEEDGKKGLEVTKITQNKEDEQAKEDEQSEQDEPEDGVEMDDLENNGPSMSRED